MQLNHHTFNHVLLDENSVVIDIGAHIGRFSTAILEQYNCRVIAYEPDRDAFQELLKIDHPKFTAFNTAVASTSGTYDFFSAKPASAANSLVPSSKFYGRWEGQESSYTVQAEAFSDVLRPFSKVDLVKMDCEGAELDILNNTPEESLKKIRQISAEFHDFCFPQITVEDTIRTIERLESIGFLASYWPDHSDPDRDYFFYQPRAQYLAYNPHLKQASASKVELSREVSPSQNMEIRLNVPQALAPCILEVLSKVVSQMGEELTISPEK